MTLAVQSSYSAGPGMLGRWLKRAKMSIKEMTPYGQFIATLVSGTAMFVLTFTGMIMVLSGKISDGQIATQAAIATEHAQTAKAIADATLSYQVENAALTARVTADEEKIRAMQQTAADHYTEETAFRTKMEAKDDTIMSQLTTIQLQLAGKEPMRTR